MTSAKATVTIEAGSQGKKISPDLFGIFFEDINYAADGGLYAELIQNRSFEYSPTRQWRAGILLTALGTCAARWRQRRIKVESAISLHENNPQYAVLTVEQGGTGVGLINSGFDGIPLQAGEKYDFTVFARRESGENFLSMCNLKAKTARFTVRRIARLSPKIGCNIKRPCNPTPPITTPV